MKKRLLAMFLCIIMMFSVCACGETDADKNTQNSENSDISENSDSQDEKQPSVDTLADYSDMSVVLSGDYEITEDVLNVYFSNVLSEAGVGLIKVTDRDTVQAGDIVKTDYTGFVNGLKFEGGSTINDGTSNPQLIDVSNNCGYDASTGSASTGFIEGFTDGLIGAKIGEPTDSPVVFPETYDRDSTLEDGTTLNLANQPAVFQFVVHEIYEVVTPENITDEFVAENLSKAYEVNTVAELMAFLEKELAYNYTINYVIENSTFTIPKSYLYARLEDYQTYFEETYCKETGLETYLSYYGYTVDQMQVEWLSQLNTQIQAELVFAAMVEKSNLTVDEAGHEAYIQSIMSANGDYFPDADSVYKYAGAGNAEAGGAYMKNQATVRDNFIANYDK